MGIFRNPLISVCAFFYGCNTVLKQFVPIQNSFLKFYLNDLVCMPLVFGAAIFLQRNIILRQPAYSLTKWNILAVSAYFAFMFEGIIPLFHPRYTADFLDVIAYFSGSWLFYIFGNASGTDLVNKTYK